MDIKIKYIHNIKGLVFNNQSFFNTMKVRSNVKTVSEEPRVLLSLAAELRFFNMDLT